MRRSGVPPLAIRAVIADNYRGPEPFAPALRSVAMTNTPEVSPKRIAEIGMRAVVDNRLGSLIGIFPPQIGYSLLGHDHLHGMLAMVKVRT